ncbi:MAG: putative replication protein A2, 32kDa [Streblomastix strix]|uniref:Putative replication protein A2, 32kDa n=1 Tax=Streblomastix strix TaxID=222440 RepID=A0A5J4TML7_9EUKA|nr:MAG: putative replication protein A2, 32kDa [Streblomastix strix]
MDGGFFQSPQKEEQQGRQRTLENSTLIPLTVKMLLEAKKDISQSPFQVDGADITNVEIVGLILELSAQANFINYKVDDGTGCIDVRQWNTPGVSDEDQQQDTQKEGSYVRVCGTLTITQDVKTLVAFQIHQVTDFNEITYHNLSIIHSHLIRTKGPLQTGIFDKQRQQIEQSKVMREQGQSPGRPQQGWKGQPGMTQSPQRPSFAPQQRSAPAQTEYRNGAVVETGRFGQVLSDCLQAFRSGDAINRGGLSKKDLNVRFDGRYTDQELQVHGKKNKLNLCKVYVTVYDKDFHQRIIIALETKSW